MNVSFIAAIQQGREGATPAPSLRDIAGPIEAPMPLWLMLLIVLGAIAAVSLLGWLIMVLARRKPAVPPLTPRQIAVRALADLRAQLHSLAPYDFSVAVSDILRRFIDAQFHLRSERQTSPEFLASIQHATSFSSDDQRLLSEFLDRCDLVKFARADADESTSEALLASASNFVQAERI